MKNSKTNGKDRRRWWLGHPYDVMSKQFKLTWLMMWHFWGFVSRTKEIHRKYSIEDGCKLLNYRITDNYMIWEDVCLSNCLFFAALMFFLLLLINNHKTELIIKEFYFTCLMHQQEKFMKVIEKISNVTF